MTDSLIGGIPDIILFLIMFAAILVLAVGIIVVRKKARKNGNSTPELEYQKRLRQATEGLYENIFELDITHNCAYGEKTKDYFKSLGVPDGASYFEALKVIAQKQIHEDYVQGYLETFCPENVLKNYEEGNHNLTYDFLIATDGENYRWMRIVAQVFFWQSDGSVHLISYRQSIDEEKQRELSLLEKARTDSLSGVYNKKTVEELVTQALESGAQQGLSHAFLLFDIDNFKTINDNLGHNFGDSVIREFAAGLKDQFRGTDIIGRIGGDEFVVLMENCGDTGSVKAKLMQVCAALGREYYDEKKSYAVTASVGAAIFPEHGGTYRELYEKADQALYLSKGHGKNTFDVYDEDVSGDFTFRVNDEAMKRLMSAASDGISKIGFTEKNFKMLYFDEKRARLTGTPGEVLRDPDFDVLSQFCAEDVPPALVVANEAVLTKEPFTVYMRLRHADGHYIPVRLRGLFVDELYEGKYPVFYALYTDLTRILEQAEEGKFRAPSADS